jgi:hypothetical protein
LFDGMLSLPFGEFSDVIWAPLYWWPYRTAGKGEGGNFIEEIVPLLILYLLYINVVLPML